MISTRSLTLVFTLLFAIPAAAQQRPRNVILLVGDGMGPAHVTVAKNVRNDAFQIGRMKHVGLVTTHCADSAVTDSAAAASAYATGEKAKYRALSVDAEGKPRQTVIERAHAAGRATGVVTTTYFWDATPAAFLAHAANRYDDAPAIVRQIASSGVDLIAGAGRGRLGKNGLPAAEELSTSGLEVTETIEQLAAAKGRVLLLLPDSEIDEENPAAPLAKLTEVALQRLSRDPDGFFLLVEHEGIDWAGHNNSSSTLRSALASLDKAVGVALEFASRRDDTLVIVTGDHETGGLRIGETRDLRRWRSEWATGDHTATMVPIFAFGAGAADFMGIQDNTDVGKKLLAIQGK